MAESAGPTMQTEVQSPASTIRFFPISLTLSMTWASSHVFMEVRSIKGRFGNAPVISPYIGPENVFSATVVRIVETPKPAAAWDTKAALFRSTTVLMDLVAKDIWD